MIFQGGNRLVIEKLKQQNDRYHQINLSQIRNSKKIKDNKLIPKILDRKKLLIEQQKRQSIEKQNSFLKLKLNRIMQKKYEMNIVEVEKIKQPHNYKTIFTENQSTRQKINNPKSSYPHQKYNQSWRQTQKYKKSISKHKFFIATSLSKNKKTINDQLTNTISYKLRHITKQQVEQQKNDIINKNYDETIKANKQIFEGNIKLFQDISKYKNQNELSELIFTNPEKIEQRIILYKSSNVINQKNYLIEISIAYTKLFIIVFDIRDLRKIFRLIYNQSKYLEILQENQYNFQILASKIEITQNGIHLKKQIKTKSNEKNNSQTNKATYKNDLTLIMKQTQFLKRNFYDQYQKKALNKKNKNFEFGRSQKLIISMDEKPSTSHEHYRFNYQNNLNKFKKKYHNKIFEKQFHFLSNISHQTFKNQIKNQNLKKSKLKQSQEIYNNQHFDDEYDQNFEQPQ